MFLINNFSIKDEKYDSLRDLRNLFENPGANQLPQNIEIANITPIAYNPDKGSTTNISW